ncbi:hypothetical protein C5167_022479 [Papaver somniferum]|uniref:Uncharacterized protein n=1 Tax=Papaver somniferum TaxID=3469 RepID=A0A4Y7JLV0_PAPSO|nr:hypothetical protein C5167_022479 [Papaver somniferum]
MVPPLPNHSLGNSFVPACRTIEQAIYKFQVNYGMLSSLQDVHEMLNKMLNKEELELHLHTITSWCRFPFGRGKSTWICTLNVIAKNVCLLMDELREFLLTYLCL